MVCDVFISPTNLGAGGNIGRLAATFRLRRNLCSAEQ